MTKEARQGSSKAESRSSPDAFSATFPAINLPKGGGAIRGVGEKFAANPVTGTGSMSVPIATSPGRSGFAPQLSLSYDSGSGNGPFGIGWSLSLPSITRKTDKGLPQYHDAEESDVFILSGAEDLVPILSQNAQSQWVPEVLPQRKVDNRTYRIVRYRPRIEGLFARIERWANQSDPTDILWRSISKDNITTWYGRTVNSRIADPSDPSRIFSWLICESHDDKGNVIEYSYKEENSEDLAIAQANELNRTRSANRYLKWIRYGNHKPYLPQLLETEPWPTPPGATSVDGSTDWYFEVVFDYGEHHSDVPLPTDAGIWPCRKDPFSSYRSGFEVRTYRLCQRVLMFHHFDGEGGVGKKCLVRSTDFYYSYEKSPDNVHDPVYSFLLSVTQTGYKRSNGKYLLKSLPPVEFEYTQPIVQDAVEDVAAASLENLPVGVEGFTYQWTDLHGEGIPGILTEQSGAWFYKRNLSPISREQSVEFAPLELISVKPNLPLASGAQFMDLAGDGLPDLVVLDGPLPGFYEHDEGEGWQPFRPCIARLNRDLRDPNLKFIDLDGDGHADVLITEDNAFVWHASLGEAGFGPARRVAQALDEEKGPRVVFADATQSIYLADLSGDGLTDLARIRNGEVCYWPNLGYGRFGAKVTMDHAPWFDHPDQFEPKRLRLADIDGSGTTDIIYLHRDGVRLYFNQSGNSWSKLQVLRVFPRVDDLVSIVPADLLGNGTACLVWSSPLPGDLGRPMRYVNLMGGQKPHLLVKTINNLGAETRVDYAPSTKFYLQDKRAGKPWITRLPFPVHVVERVETIDHISRNRFVTRYAYHHGYFDGEEREFRGFGMVEQWDTEEIGALGAQIDASSTNWDASSCVPPVHTKTWFHTGIYLGRERVSNFFAGLLNATDRGEYYREPGLDDAEARDLLLPDTVLPEGLTPEEEREACRALKGSILRQEVYADDAGAAATAEQIQRSGSPYTVTEQNFTTRKLQPRGDNRHAVFFTHPCEALNFHYERNPADPRIQHALTLEVDAFGNVLKQAAIGYGRRKQIRVVNDQGNVQQVPNPGLTGLDATDQAKQTTPLLTYTENRVTKDHDTGRDTIDRDDDYRIPLPCETVTFELTGYKPTGAAGRYQSSDLVEPDPDTAGRLRHKVTDEVPYEAAVTGNPCRRPIEWLRTLYRRDDLTSLLPSGDLQPLALPGESYKLAFTPGLLDEVFQRDGQALLPEAAAVLATDSTNGNTGDHGGYVDLDGDGCWWIPSGRSFFTTRPEDSAADELAQARQHFFLPRRFRDPFGHDAFVAFDAKDLLVVETRDALDNRVTVEVNDYRVLQPRQVSDPNRNRTEVAFDTLGMVVGTAVMGKEGVNVGDSLEDFVAEVLPDQLERFMAAPRQLGANPKESEATEIVHELLQQATTRIVYDLERFMRLGEPPFAATIARETHVSDLKDDAVSKLQISFSYSDGFGREIQKKIQAEPGPFDANDPLSPIANPRWVGSGWTIFNNKGKPVRQYEPFFSIRQGPDGTLFNDHRFEFGVTVGVSPILFYDPAERVVATLHPNHTYEKVVFDPWQQTTWDVNDTIRRAGAAGNAFDPKDDPDVGQYFARLPNDDYRPTWYDLRTDPAKALLAWPDVDAMGKPLPDNAKRRAAEETAADKAAAHADTPTIAHFDALGRPFLTVAHNRTSRNGALMDEKYPTRIELDIEGNQREVLNALGRIVMRYDYSIAGPAENEETHTNRIHQSSMEAGERWTLNNVAGKPIRAWDSRGYVRTLAYDKLQRLVRLYVHGNGLTHVLAEKTIYGEDREEGVPNPEQTNHRGKVYQVYDGAGIFTNKPYDFKGNLLRTSRQLLQNYRQQIDWKQEQSTEGDPFPTTTRYDALNREVGITLPDRSEIRHSFNEANLLDKVEVNLRGEQKNGEPKWTPFVANIDYNAKGQRELIVYGNGAQTAYEYDPLTFHLAKLTTTRAVGLNGVASQIFADSSVVQDLRYTYDPAGNITRIEDAALKTVFHDSEKIETVSEYTYDALYRLIEAKGREHIGQSGFQFNPPDANRRDYPFVGAAHSNDLQALRNYTERYEYDAVGNFEFMRHVASGGGWAREYAYEADSLIEPGKKSNRLTKTKLDGHTETYSYTDEQGNDVHGCMTAINSMKLIWDFEDQLQQVHLGGGGTAYYVYDAAGQRVRKVIESQNGTRQHERIYLGGFEVFRQHSGSKAGLVRQSLHVMDDKQRIALVETRTQGEETDVPQQLIRYQFGNHLGSASVELDRDGALISYDEYYPYGTTAFQAGRSAAEVGMKRYRYTGKERDEETGFNYHGARYYAPWLGRWASLDPAYAKPPIGRPEDDSRPLGVSQTRDNRDHRPNESDQVNAHYSYVNCRPIVLIDRAGLKPGHPTIELMQRLDKERTQQFRGTRFSQSPGFHVWTIGAAIIGFGALLFSAGAAVAGFAGGGLSASGGAGVGTTAVGTGSVAGADAAIGGVSAATLTKIGVTTGPLGFLAAAAARSPGARALIEWAVRVSKTGTQASSVLEKGVSAMEKLRFTSERWKVLRPALESKLAELGVRFQTGAARFAPGEGYRGTVYLPQNPTVVEFNEELFHVMQYAAQGWKNPPPMHVWEIPAAQWIIKLGTTKNILPKLTATDVADAFKRIETELAAGLRAAGR